MATFELQHEGRTFEVDAPTMEAAAAALQDHGDKLKDHFRAAGSFFGGVLNGVPIAGAALHQIPSYINAAVDTASRGTPFRENLKNYQESQKRSEDLHPGFELGGEITGGVASTAAVGSTTTGAKLLGLTGRTLPELMAKGAISNTVINAADAAMRGENPLAAGAEGLVTGAVSPVAGRAVSTVAAPVIRTARSLAAPADEAARRVAGGLQRDIHAGGNALSPQQFMDARVAGQPVALMDLGGETTRALARSAANTSPEARTTVNQTINPRFEAQSTRLSNWLNSTFHYPNAEAQQTAIDALERQANSRAYALANQQGNRAIWNDDIRRLSRSPDIREAILSGRRFEGNQSIIAGRQQARRNPFVVGQDGSLEFRDYGGSTAVPDIAFWDGVKKRLQDREGSLLRAGNKQAAMQTGQLRRELVAHLDTAVPGYQTARQGAARFFGAENALEAGQIAAGPQSRMSNREVRAALQRFSPEERQLFQDGFVDSYRQQILQMPDRRSVLNSIAQSPAARERLTLALGHDRANELEAMLRVEGAMDLARTAVQGNSTTARQLVELGLAGGVGGYETYAGDPQALMKAFLVYGAVRGHRAIDERVAQHVARLLTSSDPTQLRRGMRLLARNQTLLNSVREADAALASIAARGAEPAVAGALGLQ